MKQVFVAQNPTEAHFVGGLLESRGIRAEVRGEGLWLARGEAPLTPETLPTVWALDDSQVAEALRIIEDYSSDRSNTESSVQSWLCPACGQALEPQFTACWNCGATGPGSGIDEAT
jgi:hypothetical protein